MKITKFAAPFVLVGLLTIGAIGSPVSAHTLGAGKPSYGCQINPKAAACQQAPGPTIASGNVTRVSTTSTTASSTQPSALPQSGGGIPAAPAMNLGALFAAAVLSVLGLALRRYATQRI
jgi:hypothetical protein